MIRHRSLQLNLRNVGRCALSGLLIGALATQSFAAAAPALTTQPSPPLNTESVAGMGAPLQIASVPAEQILLAGNTTAPLSALPNAPGEASSSLTPETLHLMVDDAKQAEQAVASPASNEKRVQRPGMLVLGIAGIPLMALGAWVYSIHTNGSKASSLKSEYGTAFMAPGAAMSVIGFYFAFHKKKQ